MTQPLPDETPEVLEGPSLVPRWPWLSRPVVRAAGGGVAVLVAVVVVLLTTGVFRGPGTIVVRGTQFVIADPFGRHSVKQAYPDVTEGTRVIIVGPSGSVVGTGTLLLDTAGTRRALKIAVSGTPVMPVGDFTAFVAEYDFTARVPAGLSRYGIRLGVDRAMTWFTERQMRRGPVLSLGSLGG